jgi:hypothetical protein
MRLLMPTWSLPALGGSHRSRGRTCAFGSTKTGTAAMPLTYSRSAFGINLVGEIQFEMENDVRGHFR